MNLFSSNKKRVATTYRDTKGLVEATGLEPATSFCSADPLGHSLEVLFHPELRSHRKYKKEQEIRPGHAWRSGPKQYE